MLKVFTILYILFFSTSGLYPQDSWILQPSPTAKNLRTCFFSDSLNGWIGGDSGIIFHTSNEGKSWAFQPVVADYAIISMYFVNERIGYALTWEVDATPPNYYGTRILSTTNGGDHWNNYLFADTSLFLNSIYFLDSLNGFTGGTEGKIFYTTNAGDSWNLSVMDSGIVSGFPIKEIKFYNSKIGYAVGGVFDIAGVIYKTTNGGRNWGVQIVGPEPVFDLYISDSLNAIGVGGDFEYGPSKVSTANGGLDWNYHEFGIFGIANSIGFRTKTDAWISLGIIDSFLVSTNAGADWTQTAAPGGANIYKLIFVDERNGWAVGNNGVILKFNPDAVSVAENNLSVPESFVLYQNYPNPFNPETRINYELRSSGHVDLKIFNILGEELMTLVNGKQSEGSYTVSFSADNFQSGIYLYRLTTVGKTGKEFSQTKKMILLK